MKKNKIVGEVSAMDAFFDKNEKELQLWKWLNKLPMSHLAGPLPETTDSAPRSSKTRDVIPSSFDARSKWPFCRSVIGSISNQKECGSCWAMATSAVFSDRACIKSGGISKDQYSPQYMVDCYMEQLGCGGGFPATVWKDIAKIGMVKESCLPFLAEDGDCPSTCKDGTPINDAMKRKATGFFSPWGDTDESRVQAIQREIMTNGPVAASMLVFKDFYNLDHAVYKRSKSSPYVGGHVVRIIGWGTQNGQDYWLVANSWGDSWNEGGLFKISRGNNECNIENVVVVGTPV